ncbi:BofC C-terminal domain-containing protein [Brevibacillus ruminantium]|uniref:BofC C-terminal domain-containing protein n=1 Tax=Brevibacillus ruminantium TaxID=2950604 RepID=A0ABY4WDW8_9BACL|nr:BofC C-terminal domain-containing protein [Brevibacillus ruminantium]USG64112.1 BofC C-terminal domain-containing protein [Brevibacillus ruminantium]
MKREWKKEWNWNGKRRWMVHTVWSAALAAGVVGGFAMGKSMDSQPDSFYRGASVDALATSNAYQVVFAKTYLCGVKTEEVTRVPKSEVANTLANHKGWEVLSADPEKLILFKRENDIAPECKENGYIGISTDGMLTLFHGLPEEAEVVQTFYRINTEKMEARMSKEDIESLKKGIRIRDLAEYNSVLSTYGEFQIGAGNE